MKLAFLPVITAAVLFSWQGFIARVQYLNVVAAPHPAPITTTIERFVRNTFGLAPQTPPSIYDAEMEMSPGDLLNRWDPLIQSASQRSR